MPPQRRQGVGQASSQSSSGSAAANTCTFLQASHLTWIRPYLDFGRLRATASPADNLKLAAAEPVADRLPVRANQAGARRILAGERVRRGVLGGLRERLPVAAFAAP